ncbi:RimK family alpha-L-glutamate ligase [bacterium]|nr:RimK family alpha-L-glutamate ligase [bacterium]
MGKIGIYVERYTISSADQMNGLMRFAQVALHMGHRTDFLFRPDMFKIREYDAIYIRAMTDPLNSSYVAARIAEMNGIRVIDDSRSIRICCDKVNMYQHLISKNVAIPQTMFLHENELTADNAKKVFALLGNPVVLKAPNSAFSLYVDRAETVEEFIKIGKRYFRRADRIVAQRFVKSAFDWRVGMLGGKPIYVCQYMIPKKRWKIATYTPEGRSFYGPVRPVALDSVDPLLLERAQQAAAAIGNGLYGIDLKQVGDDYLVIEVNDNPTINAGGEDKKAPHLNEQLIEFLLSGSC